jgi:hypothetical protein
LWASVLVVSVGYIMNPPSIVMEPQVMRTGLKHAMARSQGPLLCVMGPASIRFIGMSGMRMMVSWEHPIAGPASPQVYVFPELVTHLLATRFGRELTRMTLGRVGKDVMLEIADEYNQCQLRWRTDPGQFFAPPEFAQMLAVPKAMINLSYLSLSDAAHQAVANLAKLQSVQNIPVEKLAVLVDFSSSLLTLAGCTIAYGVRGAYYFDPRLILRALEIIKSNALRVGMTPLPVGHRAVLTLLADQQGGQVQCALLSIGMETQRLYPLPPEHLVAAPG